MHITLMQKSRQEGMAQLDARARMGSMGTGRWLLSSSFATYRQVLSFGLLSLICGALMLTMCQEREVAEADFYGHLTLAESPFHC